MNTVFEITKAHEIATQLNADPDDDWTYRVIVSPDGKRGRVEIIDGNGEKVGEL